MASSIALLAACALCAGGVRLGPQSAPSTPPAAQTSPGAATPPAAATPPQWDAIASGSTEVADPSGQGGGNAGQGGATSSTGGANSSKGGATYRYRLVLPPARAIADPGARVPLVVFLHGSGERGDDNTAQLKHFAGWCAGDELQSKHPCYVLAMQCPAGETWAALDLKSYRENGTLPTRSPEPTRAMRALMQAIDEVVAARAVDPTRIYLTGLSMGGFGAFDLAARRPAQFAAVVPICGGGDPSTAATVARIPFYIVHGTDDAVVPVGLSRAMNEAIAAASSAAWREDVAKARGTGDAPRPMPKRAPNPMYREYDKVGHDSWTPAYRFGDEGVLDWMFAQRKAPVSG